MKQDKAIVVFSGGQDSTTCLFWAKDRFKEVEAVTFDYGQRHALEIECAKEIAEELGIKHHILDMSLLNQLAPNALTRESMEVAEGGEEGGSSHPPLCQEEICFFYPLRVCWRVK